MSDEDIADALLESVVNHMNAEADSVTFNWSRGFPQERGIYLVDLGSGEYVVTPWQDGTQADTYGDSRGKGWTCLTHSGATVARWVHVRELNNAV